MLPLLSQVLTIRERQRLESIPTSWGVIPNTNPYFPVGVASDHLWYNSGTVAGPSSAAPLGILPVCQEVQARPALRLTPLAPRTFLLPPVYTLSLTRSWPELSYSASWSERLIQPTNYEACVQHDMRMYNESVLVASLSQSDPVSFLFINIWLFP